MQQFLYNLVNWQYFGIFVIVWAVIDLVWIGRWRALLKRIDKLLSKPVIFKKDDEPRDPPLYPRVFLEQLALNIGQEPKKEGASPITAESNWKVRLSKWLNSQRDQVFDSSEPQRTLGYIIALILFTLFLIADAIAIAHTMVLLGLISPDLPPILQRLDLAILGGATLAVVVGAWMLVELSGKSDLINIDQLHEAQKKILKVISVFVILFGIVIMVAFTIERLIIMGYLQSSPTMKIMLSVVLYGVQPINTSLAAALTFQPAIRGIIVVVFLLVSLLVGILPVIAFLLDISWRGAYIIIDIAAWALLTPILALPYGLGKLFKWV